MNVEVTKSIAFRMRQDIVEMCYRLGENAAHLGSCMSLVELLAVLYNDCLKFDRNNMSYEYRDRIIMSKGQGSIALYAAMHQMKIIQNLDEVGKLIGEGNIYYKQSVRNLAKGIEFSSGSLGQGLAYAVGIAWALKLKGNTVSKVYVFVGDGECDEGSIWEAASLAGHKKLENLIVIIDRNGLQIDGFTNKINRMDKLEDRWRSFGFECKTIDGHNIEDIYKAYTLLPSVSPCAIIADTIKGKGISFAENEVEWHQNVLTEELRIRALKDIGKADK